MMSQPSPYTIMPRACISCGRPIPHRPHAPKCPRGRHDKAPTPYRAHYKEQHGYAHQIRAKRMIAASPHCAYAYLGGCHGPLTLDYIIPISRGGQASDHNAQVLCQRHNYGKGNRT